ncbi:MAG: biotin transporter BioY [Clostridia bacterium]|nr:biotin transporter BioY [Clostridia bacterium]
MKKRRSIKFAAVDIAECAIFVSLMVVGTYVAIPFWPVPLTFQTVICIFSGLTLGWKKSAVSMAVYMVMGLIGIPVFSGGGAGFAYVLKPTFGYIIGFIAAAAVAGLIRGKNAGAPLKRYLVAAVAAFLVNYAVGIPYFSLMWKIDGNADLGAYILSYNVLYMPKDFALAIVAAMLAWKIVPLISRRRAKLGRRLQKADGSRTD